MEIPIWGWCIIVAAIIILAVLSNFFGRRYLKPREIEEDGKASSSVTLEKKDPVPPVKEDGKSKTNEKAHGDNLV
ncbi:unnamed protein product [Arabidopsis halleri]